ncbi:hypothetical protein BDN71DRAFT_1509190 [Pleurotus eryngii]|uniref:Uncharacterized protein n=1 Tax=Pleurotus eryngii TaxID=5323 RepID=A0A9P5ZRP6_PLEER|nr:hypothetical protein BDN71DRAFT_1509190 [Pleurotus eryngii]
MTDWKMNVDGQWSSMREEWSEERARLAKASEEWEAKIKQVDSKLATLNAVSDPPLASGPEDHQNGNLRHVLATPPSPRSLSSDSGPVARAMNGEKRGLAALAPQQAYSAAAQAGGLDPHHLSSSHHQLHGGPPYLSPALSSSSSQPARHPLRLSGGYISPPPDSLPPLAQATLP